MGLTSNIKDKDWVSVRQGLAKLGSSKLGPTSTPTYAGLTLTGLTVNSLVYPVVAADGTSTGALTSLGAATDGELPIGDTGGVPVLANITQGSANQVRVANAAGSITLSTPQNIHTGASNFTVAGATITGLTQGSVVFAGAGGIISQDNSNLFWDDTNNRLGIGVNTGFDPRIGLTISGDIDILHTSSEADDHAFEIDVDAAGYGDVKAINIDYITGAIAKGEDEGIILINIDEIAATGGDVFGLEVLATEGAVDSTTTVYGLKAGVLVGPIHQDSGTFDNPAIGTNDTLTTPVAEMIDGDSGPTKRTTIFVAVDDWIIIGATAAFQEIEFILTTPTSNPGIKPTFWYSTGGSGFTQFTPVDGTNGFRNTGVIAWDADDLTGHAVNADTGAANTYDIKIIRTKAGSLSPSPILGYAKVATTTEYEWDKDGDVNVKSLVLTTDLAVAHGGTGASTATNARTNLGLVIGTNVQAWDASLDSIAGLTYASDSFIKVTAEDTYAIRTLAEVKTDLSLNLVENTAHSTDAHTMTIDGVDVSVHAALNIHDAVADTTDTSCWVGLFEDATGDIAPKTDGGLTYNAGTAALSTTTFIGALTGQADTVGTITGLAPDTATTQATQAGITTCANLTTVGTIGTGTWEATDVAIAHGGTGQSTAQAAIDALSAVSGATDEHVLTKDTASGNAVWKVATGGADAFTVKVDVGATADYLGAASSDGALRTGAGLTYTDGGNFVTLAVSGTYVDRGNPAAEEYDYEVGDFTTDATWNDLDLSGIVPAGAVAVQLYISIEDNALESYFQFRKNGNTSAYNVVGNRTQVINVLTSFTVTVGCDTNRVVEYRGSNLAFTTINVMINGWFI